MLPSSPALASSSPVVHERNVPCRIYSKLTPWTPSHYIDGLCVLDQSGKVSNLSLIAVCLDVPKLPDISAKIDCDQEDATDPHVIISACRSQTTFAMWLEVSRVYWGILIVPGHQERSSLHGE